MKRTWIILINLLLPCLAVLAGLVWLNAGLAYENTPTASNIYFWSGSSGSGGERSSTHYILHDTASQGSALGQSRSTSYQLRGGFWAPFAGLSLTTGGGGGGGNNDTGQRTEVTVSGTKASFRVDASGRVQETATITTGEGSLTISIPEGTLATHNGNHLAEVGAQALANPPAPPSDSQIIGLAYDFTPDGASFDPAIEVTFQYDPTNLPPGADENNLVVAYYDTESDSWVECTCTVDQENNKITASISHFTEFAIITRQAAQSPALFTVTDINVSPSAVKPGDAVTISVPVVNNGGTAGTYRAILSVNGVATATEEINVSAGAMEIVQFVLVKDNPGYYTVTVAGQEAGFIVTTEAVRTPAPPASEPPPAIPEQPETLPPDPGNSYALTFAIIGGAIFIWLGYFVFRYLQRRFD